MSDPSKCKTEIIAISSGKGGTGKTLIAACLGYSLMRAGHEVLMIDGDPGTDGLSLFMLGPDGMDTLKEDFTPVNTFCHVLESNPGIRKQDKLRISFKPHDVNRKHDHGIIWKALISGKTIYGDIDSNNGEWAIPRPDQLAFERSVSALFEKLRSSCEFDYVLVDTRGGFAFESTIICALADSFIVVTEADYTNFYQDRNLIKRINGDAERLKLGPLLRAIIVNKATHGEEKSFRLELEREFPITFKDTHPVPLDLDALEAYRHQQLPFVGAQSPVFSSATLRAFSRIMRLVTGGWKEERIDKWNDLVAEISRAHKANYSLSASIRKRLISRRYTIGLIVVLALLLPTTILYQDIRKKANKERMVTVYSTDAAPSLRVNYLLSLYKGGTRSFNGVDISGLDLSQIVLDSIELRRANLRKTVLTNTNLKGADLTGADMRGANLTGADLRDTDLKDALLDGANLRKANLRGAKLTPTQLKVALVDENTILPDGSRVSPPGK